MSDVVYHLFHAPGQRDKIQVPAGYSITVADLDRHIKDVKFFSLSPRQLAERVLLFHDARTGEEYAADSSQIPAGSTVVVRLLTMWSAAFQGSKRAAEFRRLAADAQAERARKTAESRKRSSSLTAAKRGSWDTPASGYVCHRCGELGHYIKYCPTNGDPRYDSRVSGVSASKKGNEICRSATVNPPSSSAASSSSSAASSSFASRSYYRSLPTLVCTLCKNVMRNAAVTRCCFESFCDECIAARIASTSFCVCGAADASFVPNKTIRELIAWTLEEEPSVSTITDEERVSKKPKHC